jgi:hypothetical protein
MQLIPVRQQQYRLNPNYAMKVKEEIDKLLQVGFIKRVKRATWLSSIVVVPKKNDKLRVCVDYRKLNAATITNAFPLPFTNGHYKGIPCLPQQFAAILPRRGKVVANFFFLSGKFAAYLVRQFAATFPHH